jgi:small subunit ribosomal protein S16
MSVKLRLMRFGKTHRPYYRLCALDTKKRRDGAYIESIGVYDPLIEDDQKKVRLNKERAEYWLSVGAQPSDTVRSFLQRAHVTGLIKAKKSKKKRPSKTKKIFTPRELSRKAAKKKKAEAKLAATAAKVAGRQAGEKSE